MELAHLVRTGGLIDDVRGDVMHAARIPPIRAP